MSIYVRSQKRTRLYLVQTVVERFWPKVDRNGPVMPGMATPCWIWTGSSDDRGYGQIRESHKRGHLLKAHRVAYEITNGSIPDGMMVLHRCDNPPCVRADDHLFLGTAADNSRDAARKGRLVFQVHPERCPRGENSSSAKLTTQQVLEIRRLRTDGWTQTKLAEHFGVSQAAIWFLLAGRTWSDVGRGQVCASKELF